MAVINVAFSSGLESVAMVVKALRDGHRVNLCVLNVSNNRESFMFEAYNTSRFIDYVKEHGEALGFIGKIDELLISPRCPWAPSQRSAGASCDLVVNHVTQQFATVMGMMDLRRYNLVRDYPSVWIGWLKEDASEFSFNEYDHSEADYGRLLAIPKEMGPLSMADRTGTMFRAPLWNMSKAEVYLSVPEELRQFVIHTGSANVSYVGNKITYTSYPHKKDEWDRANIPGEMCNTRLGYELSDIPLTYRILSGTAFASDVGLPETANRLVRDLGETFSFGILGGSFSGMDYVVDQFKAQVESIVDAVNKNGLRFPTNEEKQLAGAYEELEHPACGSITIDEKGDQVILRVGRYYVVAPDTDLLDKARVRLEEQKQRKLVDFRVEVLQDGTAEPEISEEGPSEEELQGYVDTAVNGDYSTPRESNNWNGAGPIKAASPALCDALPETHPMLGGGVNP